MLRSLNWVLTILSLVATWANATRLIWCFYIWIFTNLAYVLLDIFIYDNWARAILTLVQLIFCFVGIYEWRKLDANRNNKY